MDKLTRRLLVETLEDRLAMAGNVTAVLSGANLTLTGDALGNSIAIKQTSATGFLVSGVSTRINGLTSKLFNIVGGKLGTLMVNLQGGNDTVSVGSAILSSAARQINGAVFSVLVGDGNDRVTMNNVAASQRIVLGLGGTAAGSTDTATLTKVTSANQFYVTGARGRDVITLDGCRATSVFEAKLGDGNDSLTIKNSTGRTAKIDTGAGADVVAISKSTATALTANLGAGNDSISFASSTIGTLTVDGGTESDTLRDLGGNRVTRRTVRNIP